MRRQRIICTIKMAKYAQSKQHLVLEFSFIFTVYLNILILEFEWHITI